MEPPDAQLCRAGWVMCHEGGAAVAETYWGALRVPRAPSVKPGAACCCLCLFAWSPSGTPTSPGPRRRSFNNDGSVAARRSVTLRTVRSEDHQTRHLGRTIHRQPHVFPAVKVLMTTTNRSQKLVHQVGTRLAQGSAQGWHKVEVGQVANSPFRVVGVVSVCCQRG